MCLTHWVHCIDKQGRLVEHSGKIIKESPTGKAAKVLKYLKNVKPKFFDSPVIMIMVIPKDFDFHELIYNAPPMN